MEYNDGRKSIQNMLTAALVFQVLYCLSVCMINVMPRPFMGLISLSFQSTKQINPSVPCMFGAVLTTILFVVWYLYLMSAIKRDVKISNWYHVLMGISVGVFYYVIPTCMGTIQNIILGAKNRNGIISMEIYAASVALNNVQNIAKPFLFVAVVLLLCAYVIFWARGRYGQKMNS